MAKKNELLIAPARNGKPAAQIWRFWTNKSDIYGLSRQLGMGHYCKLSIHETGPVYIGQVNTTKALAHACPLSNGWRHAIQIRFLVSNKATPPSPRFLQFKGGMRIHYIDVPPDHTMAIDILISNWGVRPTKLPSELAVATDVWRVELSDGRVTAIVASVYPMEEQDKLALQEATENLRVHFKVAPGEAYSEIFRIHPDERGNVLLVMPLGKEAIQLDVPTTAEPDRAEQ